MPIIVIVYILSVMVIVGIIKGLIYFVQQLFSLHYTKIAPPKGPVIINQNVQHSVGDHSHHHVKPPPTDTESTLKTCEHCGTMHKIGEACPKCPPEHTDENAKRCEHCKKILTECGPLCNDCYHDWYDD